MSDRYIRYYDSTSGSTTTSTYSFDKTKKYKLSKTTGAIEEVTTVNPLAADEISIPGSKSSLRRIADLERNVSVLASKAGIAGATNSDTDTVLKTSAQALSTASNALTSSNATITLARGDGTTDVVTVNNVANASAATTATKWATARTISLSGDASGSVSIDGSANVTLTVAVANDSHTHAFSNLTGKPTTLEGYGITDAAPDTAFVGVTVSNDTLTFTRDNGTTIAVTTSDANTNYYVTGGSFDAATQVLTLTRNSGSATVDLSDLVTSAELSTAISNLVNGADAAYDTLKEIQDAMATDAELSAAISGLTIGNGVMTIAPGAAMTGGGSFTANQTGNSTVTISHADTSSQASVNNSGRTYIQDVTLDAYGHVTGLVSATETVTDTWRGITDTPTNDSATSISAAWAQSAFVGASVSNDTITFTKGDGTTTSVTTSDANTVYAGWNLLTDGTSRGAITSAENVNFVGGTNVTLGYSATDNTITINSTDTNTTYGVATTSANGLMSSTDKSKLDGIEAGATADQTKADIDALGIAASTAATLATARTIGMSGVTATATSFNGSANITIPVTAVPATLLTGTIANARISGAYTGMTNLTGSGTVDFAKFLGNAADTAALPSFSWTGDTNTGMYQPAADQLGFATGGASRAIVSASGLAVTGAITATGDVTAYSDDRLKTNVKTIEGALGKVAQVRGVTFDRIEDGSTSTGVVAQELAAVLPEAVKTDANGMHHVAYGNITGLLIEAIKELKDEIDYLKGLK